MLCSGRNLAYLFFFLKIRFTPKFIRFIQNSIFKNMFLFMCICACLCMYATCVNVVGGQKRESDFPGTPVTGVVSAQLWVLRTELRFWKHMSILNCRASLQPQRAVIFIFCFFLAI